MGDHFMLLMDPLLTESTIEAASESRNLYQQATPSANRSVFYPQNGKGFWFPPSKLVECRMCHDGGEDSNMEIPCSCCGSLKYAHRKCVQRWCNDKGDTICEICFEFMVLLVLCHTLPIVISGVGDYSLTWTVRLAGMLYVFFFSTRKDRW